MSSQKSQTLLRYIKPLSLVKCLKSFSLMQTARCRSSVTDSLEAVGVSSPQAHVMDNAWLPRSDLNVMERRIINEVGLKITDAVSTSAAALTDAMQASAASQTAAMQASAAALTDAMQAKADSNASKMESYMFRYAVLWILAMFLVPVWTKYMPL